MDETSSCSNTDAPLSLGLARSQRRLIVVRKRWAGVAGWSDAIQKFYDSAADCFMEAALVEISLSGFAALFHANRKLNTAIYSSGTVQSLVILVNHSICWLALWPTLRRVKRQGATVVLCMHEHEHILGMPYVWRNLGALSWREIVRYSRLYHSLAAKQATKVLVLAEAQAAVLGVSNSIRASFLPVDGNLFPPDIRGRHAGSSPPVVLFAHDPQRFDKGHRFVGAVSDMLGGRVTWVYGRQKNLPFEQVYKKYWDADILFLPSDWESYSLVFIEALACNKFIVCSPYVGAARLLLAKYSADELLVFGLCVARHDVDDYFKALEFFVACVEKKGVAKTRKLFEEFGFNRSCLPLSMI